MTCKRRISAATAAVVLLAMTATGCGDDDGQAASTSAAPASEFCSGFLALDRAFASAPEDPAQLEAFVDEQVTPNLEMVRANLPESIESEAGVMLQAVDAFIETGDPSSFEAPEFGTASVTVYGSLDELCDVPVVHVDLGDYAFQGLPTDLPAGVTSFVVQNHSSTEAHQMELIKVQDGVDLTVQEIAALPDDERDDVLESFGGGTGAIAGGGGGTTVDLTAGRWMVVCPLPVTGDESHLHWQKGMLQELTAS